MGSDQFFERNGGEDVAVVDEEGFVRDPGLDVFEAAAGFEEGWFVEEIDGVSAPEAVGGGVAVEGSEGGGVRVRVAEGLPDIGQVVGVYGEAGDSGVEASVEDPVGEGAVEEWDEGFGDAVGHRLKPCAESCAEDECLSHGDCFG